MKKTLLMAAAALAAGVISIQAQVYSQNVVGYYNVVLNSGYNIVVNSFSVNNGTNGANEVFPNIPDSTFFYAWNGHGYNISIFDTGSGSTAPDNSWYMSDYSTPTNEPVVVSGQAVFLQLPSAVTNTVAGTVVSTNNNQLVAGYNLVGSALPVGGSLSSTNSLYAWNPPDSTFVYKWNGHGYDISIYDTGSGSTAPDNSWYMSDYSTPTNVPSLNVGQGAFVQVPSSWSWSQVYTNN